ncbi:MAG: hypothetical protein ACI82H_002278, partial [Alphaproteobacteria bacterium]
CQPSRSKNFQEQIVAFFVYRTKSKLRSGVFWVCMVRALTTCVK